MGKPGLAGPPAAVVRSRIAVPALGIAALALAIAVVPLDVLSRQGSPAEPLVAAASFTAVGLVVARRRPRNPMGWLLAVIGILILTVAGDYYAVLVYRLRDRPDPPSTRTPHTSSPSSRPCSACSSRCRCASGWGS